jgi:hypothetical protein
MRRNVSTVLSRAAFIFLSLFPICASADCACARSVQILNPVKIAGEPLLAAVSCLPDGALKTPWIWKTGGHVEKVMPLLLESPQSHRNHALLWLPGKKPGMTGTLEINTPMVQLISSAYKAIPAANIRIVKEDKGTSHWFLVGLKAALLGHELLLSGGGHPAPEYGSRIVRVENPRSLWGTVWQSPLVEGELVKGNYRFSVSECGNLGIGWSAGDELVILILHWSDHKLIAEAGWRVKIPYPAGADEKHFENVRRDLEDSTKKFKVHGCSIPTGPSSPPVCSDLSARLASDNRELSTSQNMPASLEAPQLEQMRMTQAELDFWSAKN